METDEKVNTVDSNDCDNAHSPQSREVDSREIATALLKKAVLAREASREYQRQNILATAWKIEELRRHIDLVETLQEENKGRLDKAPEDLKLFESFLLVHSLTEMRTEYMALIRIYHEDISGLTLTDEELDRLMDPLLDAEGLGEEGSAIGQS